MHILVKDLVSETALGLELVAGSAGLTRRLTDHHAQKLGLAMAGYTRSLRPQAVLVLGETEHGYLETLAKDAQAQAIDGVFAATEVGCLVVASGLEVPSYLCDKAEQAGVALLATERGTEAFVAQVHAKLEENLGPDVTVHAVMIDVFGVGVMLVGQSGIGKSECALDLVLRSHRLVADDVVRIKRVGSSLVASGNELTRYHMEVRGLGIINVKDLFGAAAVREKKRLELLVELEEWKSGVEYDRTGIDDATESILGVDIPKILLPIRPGRNLAAIIEVAARNHLLKAQGHHSAREFQRMLERRLGGAQPPGSGRGPRSED
jgi:HPr kinase/phosphorylase